MKYINTDKLKKLNINSENTYIIMDFDKTITSNESKDSWAITGSLLGEKLKQEMGILYNKYRPIEIDYTIDIEEKTKAMIEWYESCMSLYTKYNLTKDKLVKSVEEGKIIFRKGAKEFLINTYNKNIPVIILSAGIGNVIEEFLKQEDCFFENIYIIGNFIEFDENGNSEKFDNKKMIHTLNKTMTGKIPKEQQEKIRNREYKVLIGDLIEDTNMISKNEWDTTLKVGILNNKIEELIKFYNKAFDIVLTGEDATFDIFNKIIENR